MSAWVVHVTMTLRLDHGTSGKWETSRQVPAFVIDTDLSGIDSTLAPERLQEEIVRAARNVVVTMHTPPTEILAVTASVWPYEGPRS